jgi:hypothetical protein
VRLDQDLGEVAELAGFEGVDAHGEACAGRGRSGALRCASA